MESVQLDGMYSDGVVLEILYARQLPVRQVVHETAVYEVFLVDSGCPRKVCVMMGSHPI